MDTPTPLLRTDIEVRFGLLEGLAFKARSLSGTEMINRPTRLKLELRDLSSGDLPVSVGELLNTPVQVILSTQGLSSPRRFHLHLANADERWRGGAYQLDLDLANKLDRGRHLGQARLFMHLSREQVLRQLLTEMGYHRTDIDLALDPVPAFEGPFLQIDNESTLDCFHRLLADVGANYWFEDRHPDQALEHIVIRNDPQISPYLAHLHWAQATSGLVTQQSVNRITGAYACYSQQPSITAHSVSGDTPGAVSRDDAGYLTFSSPRPRPEAEQRALFEQQYYDQQRYILTLHSHQPQLSAGHSLAFDAGQLPNDGPSGDYRLIRVIHTADAIGGASAGVHYTNNATVIPRATPPRPHRKTPPPLPHLFPARIESRYPHADLNPDGHYYFRADFDTSDQPPTNASPPAGRLTPYASAKTDQPPIRDAIGWHFPLLDDSRVLVSFLDNDPGRPVIMGFIPGQYQSGPVTDTNASQSRLKTPGQNELTLDDDARQVRIALHTFDRQVCLDMSAREAEPYIHLQAIYGGVNLYAQLNQRFHAEAQLEERIGGDRLQSVKGNSSTHTSEGAVHHQAATDQTHIAQMNFSQSAGGDFSLWVQQKNLTLNARNSETTRVQNGDTQIQVSSGALIYQVNGDITVKGDGQGDILFKQGDSGFKIDKAGNVKLFGPTITLNAKSGVVFRGEVEYEAGAANEPEDAEPLDVPQIEEIAWRVPDEPEPGDYRLPVRLVDTSLKPLTGIEVQCAHLHDPAPVIATTNGDGLAVFTLPRQARKGLISFEHDGHTQLRPFHAGTLASGESQAGRKQRLVNLCATARLPERRDTPAVEQVIQSLSDELNTAENTLTDTLSRHE